MTAPNIPGAPRPKAAGGKGCLFKVALVLGVLLLVAISGLVWGTLQVMAIFKTFTSETALEIPISKADFGRVAEIQSRIDAFLSNSPPGQKSLRLTADDLNALIASAPGWKTFRSRLYFSIEEGRLKAQATFPLNALPFVEGRHLNGTLILSPKIKKGRFSAGFTEFNAGGRSLPGYLLSALNQALSGVVERRTGAMGRMLDETASISVEGDHLLLERSVAPHLVSPPSPRPEKPQ